MANTNSLIEIPYRGARFTWTNNQTGNGVIFERLEKAYCTLDWDNNNPTKILLHVLIITSDHAIIIYEANKVKCGN